MKKLNELFKKSSQVALINKPEKFDENIKLKFTAKKIAFKIFYELKSKKLAQQDLAKLLDVTPQNISKMLKGDDYKLSTLIKLEEALSINLIDREIFNAKSNVSTILYVKNFEQRTKLLVVNRNSFTSNSDIVYSNTILEVENFKQKLNFKQNQLIDFLI